MDADDWAKEDCICGHRRHLHAMADGPCMHTKMTRVPPEGLTWSGEGFEAEPSIPEEQWPQEEVTCCNGFYEAGLFLAESGP